MANSKKPALQKQFTVLLVVIAVIGAAALGWVATRSGGGGVAVDPNLPLGTAQAFRLGNPDAPVKIVEFADFECPACGQFAMLTKPDVHERLVKTGLASVEFYVFPLPMHANTWSASNAAYCANEQGKFWEMHDKLFANQQALDRASLLRYAKELGLNEAKFTAALDSQKIKDQIDADQAEAGRVGASGTPTFFINGRQIVGAQPTSEFKKLIDEELAKKK